MKTACPNCGAMLKVPDGAMGKRANCPKCGHGFVLSAQGGAGEHTSPPGRASPQVSAVPETPAAHAPACEARWHVLLQDGQKSGPFTSVQLESMIVSGQVDAATQLWIPGRSQWASANTFQELASLLSASPPPVSVYPQAAAPGGPSRPARVGLSRLCLACGYQGYMQKKWAGWVVPVAIITAFFTVGLGLLLLFVPKKSQCPQCGTFFGE